MTLSTNVSWTSAVALAAWMFGISCVSPVFAQLDAGIAPNTDQQRVPRPSGPGTVLIGNPAAPPQTADASGRAVNAGTNPTTRQLKAAVPEGYQIPPELDQRLTEWEQHSRKVERLNGKFRLYTYDEVFQTETRAEGQFWYQNPDKGRMDFRPADLSRVERENGRLINRGILGPDKRPYEVKGRDPEIWNCSGSEILQIFPNERKYNRIGIPLQFQGESIKESPLPFLFGLKKEEAKERYLMQLGPMNGKVARGYKVACIHVIAYPLREQDSREWSRAEILLDSQTFLPQSIQTFDPAGTSRNVYAFEDVEVNSRWLFKDPFSLNVSGLELVHDKLAQPGAAPANAPAGKFSIPGTGK